MITRNARHCVSGPSMGSRPLRWFVLVLAAAIGAGASSCGGAGEKQRPASAAYADNSQPSLFAVPENQVAHLQIKPVRRASWSFVVRTTGTVDWDADHTTQVITQVSGPITKILADIGTMVDAAQPLLYVSSPDVTNATAAYRKARNRMNFETASLDRSKDLLQHHAIAQKDFESAQADYNDASTDLQNALQALLIFGITQNEIDDADRQGLPINPQHAVRSPIKGMIVQKLVFPGQLIQAGATTCFLISDPATVWIQGHVYEKDLTSIRAGDAVDVTNSSFSETLHGVVSNIGAMIDPATRTTPVRITTANPHGLLKKDLFVNVAIHTRTQRNIVVVPTSAVLYDADNMPFVYVQMDGNRFGQRLVTTGTQQNNEFEILNGLKEGERVVSEGAIFLQFANTYQR
jgi:cobalt-zinc-cadmium efflux system membrane fusion protein